VREEQMGIGYRKEGKKENRNVDDDEEYIIRGAPTQHFL
jgi:hypothetical protein